VTGIGELGTTLAVTSNRRTLRRNIKSLVISRKIQAGVPQGSVLGPILYLLYTSDLPTLEQNVVATFADDIAILAIGDNNSESTEKLQTAVTKLQHWTRTWQIKLNVTKSVHIDFTNKLIEHKPIYINHHVVPYENTAKYLGIHSFIHLFHFNRSSKDKPGI
jgi:hypothetical protein